MNKQTIGYSESIEMFNPATGLKRWVKIYYDKEINEDQDPTQAFNEVKSFVQNKFHKDNNPQLTDELKPVEWSIPISSNIPSLDRKAIDDLDKAIDNSSTKDELFALLEEVKKNSTGTTLMNTFNNKLKQLS